MADIQAMRAQMLRCFRELGSLQQNNRFLRSCISEGMIPKGLRVNFNSLLPVSRYIDTTFADKGSHQKKNYNQKAYKKTRIESIILIHV